VGPDYDQPRARSVVCVFVRLVMVGLRLPIHCPLIKLILRQAALRGLRPRFDWAATHLLGRCFNSLDVYPHLMADVSRSFRLRQFNHAGCSVGGLPHLVMWRSSHLGYARFPRNPGPGQMRSARGTPLVLTGTAHLKERLGALRCAPGVRLFKFAGGTGHLGSGPGVRGGVRVRPSGWHGVVRSCSS
jgi:hypothetical protein